MIENNSEKKTLYYCENCDTTLSIGSIAKINNDHSTLFCELCGDKLLEKEKITKPLHSTHEVSDNLLYKNIFVDDKRFSKDFKGDLVSAISRIIYIKLKAAALKNNLDFTQINLENNFKNGLADYLLTEITSEQMISYEYLSETPNFQPTDFNHIYTQFQSAVKSDEMYAKGIRQYLFWLIGNIYDISSGNKTKFSPFERILTDEFKNIDENEEKFRNHNPNIIRSEAENPQEDGQRTHRKKFIRHLAQKLEKLDKEESIKTAFMKKGKKFSKELILCKFLNLHFPLLLKKGLFLNWEYVCDVCSKAYLNQDFIPPEQYIKGMENLIFLPLSSFKQIYEKWLLHKHGKNSDTLIEELGVEQFSKKSHKVSESYLAKPLPVDFDKLVHPFINTLSRYITEKDREEHSNMRYGGTHPDIALIDLYTHRSKSKWAGIIYKITQIKDLDLNPIDDGLIQIGFSTERFSSRWFWYQVDAFTHNKELEIYQLMRDFENIAGEDLRKVTKLSNNGIGYIGKYKTFTWEILEICWSDGKLRTCEIDWIVIFKKRFGDRVGNIDKGGGGGTKIVIPPILLIPLIARGYSGRRVADILKEKYNIICSKDVVNKRISEYWGSMSNARVLFIKPILKKLMSQGYSATYLSKIFYKGILTLSRNFWNEDFKVKRLEFIKKYLINLFKRGYEVYEMDSELRGVPWETVRKEYIPQWWRTIKNAQIKIVKPIIAKMLSEGYNLKDIAIFLEQDSFERLRKQISLLWAFKGGRALWGTILKFVEYIAFKKLTPNEVYKLKYDDIKDDLEKLDYIKFLSDYKKNPKMSFSMFKSLFPNKSQSTYYSWKKKAEIDV